jgi:hypothetical protein
MPLRARRARRVIKPQPHGPRSGGDPHLPHPPSQAPLSRVPAFGRLSERSALVRPRHHDLDPALGRHEQLPSSFCQIRARLHVGGEQALRAWGQFYNGAETNSGKTRGGRFLWVRSDGGCMTMESRRWPSESVAWDELTSGPKYSKENTTKF